MSPCQGNNNITRPWKSILIRWFSSAARGNCFPDSELCRRGNCERREDFSVGSWFVLKFILLLNKHGQNVACWDQKMWPFIALLFQSLGDLEEDGGGGSWKQMSNAIITRKTGLSFKNDSSSGLSMAGEIWKRIRKGSLTKKDRCFQGAAVMGEGRQRLNDIFQIALARPVPSVPRGFDNGQYWWALGHSKKLGEKEDEHGSFSSILWREKVTWSWRAVHV